MESVPFGGTVAVKELLSSTTTGFAMFSNFSISAQNWMDVSGSTPLTYTFTVVSGQSSTILASSTSPYLLTMLPQGPSNVNYTVSIIMTITNTKGAAVTLTQTVQSLPWHYIETTPGLASAIALASVCSATQVYDDCIRSCGLYTVHLPYMDTTVAASLLTACTQSALQALATSTAYYTSPAALSVIASVLASSQSLGLPTGPLTQALLAALAVDFPAQRLDPRSSILLLRDSTPSVPVGTMQSVATQGVVPLLASSSTTAAAFVGAVRALTALGNAMCSGLGFVEQV